MKRNLIALALVLFFGNVLVASAQAPVTDVGPISSRLVISKYGTLLAVRNEDGSRRYGPLYLEGFLVSYKLGGQTKFARAQGATDHERLQPGQIEVDGNSASVTTTTDDGAWEITNGFTLDEQTKRLIIRRSFRNISGRKSSLQTTEHLDPKLMDNPSPAQLSGRVLQRVAGSGCDQNLVERPPHYICIGAYCPNVHMPRLAALGKQASLGWKCPKFVDPGKTLHFAVWLKL